MARSRPGAPRSGETATIAEVAAWCAAEGAEDVAASLNELAATVPLNDVRIEWRHWMNDTANWAIYGEDGRKLFHLRLQKGGALSWEFTSRAGTELEASPGDVPVDTVHNGKERVPRVVLSSPADARAISADVQSAIAGALLASGDAEFGPTETSLTWKEVAGWCRRLGRHEVAAALESLMQAAALEALAEVRWRAPSGNGRPNWAVFDRRGNRKCWLRLQAEGLSWELIEMSEEQALRLLDPRDFEMYRPSDPKGPWPRAFLSSPPDALALAPAVVWWLRDETATEASDHAAIVELGTLGVQLDGAGAFDPNHQSDARERQLRAIAVRRGQQRFRRELIRAYEGRCVVTGCTVEAVLEAAHILPYRGDHTNHADNGLLLRADIHTLFDLGLLSIEPVGRELRVNLDESLLQSEYADLHGDRLELPSTLMVTEALLERAKQRAL